MTGRCPLCGERVRDVSAHLFTIHESEMDARRLNPADPVYAAIGCLPTRSAQERINLVLAGYGTMTVVRRHRSGAVDVKITLPDEPALIGHARIPAGCIVGALRDRLGL